MGEMTIREKRQAFTDNTRRSAMALLVEWVGEERAREAAGRVVTAITQSAISAKDPTSFYGCSPQSVAAVIATAALTGMMPGTGAAALAYAIPRQSKGVWHLNYQLSHRGCAALCRRAGTIVIPVPVGHGDELEISEGEISKLRQDPDAPVMSWSDLRGVAVIVKDVGGTVLYRGWMPRALIEQRREQGAKYGGSPWQKWPVEMAMKTAIHYAVARGWAVVDDVDAVRALSADAAAEVVETTAEVVAGSRPTSLAEVRAQREAEPAALPDYTDADEIEQHTEPEPEPVTTTTTTAAPAADEDMP